MRSPLRWRDCDNCGARLPVTSGEWITNRIEKYTVAIPMSLFFIAIGGTGQVSDPFPLRRYCSQCDTWNQV